jgi:hypothetical protein
MRLGNGTRSWSSRGPRFPCDLRKPPDAVREPLRRSGFKWSAAEKERRFRAEPMEVEGQEERRRAVAGDFPALLDTLSRRRQAAGQAAERLVRKILQALESLRVVVFRGSGRKSTCPTFRDPRNPRAGDERRKRMTRRRTDDG